jgi:type IV fimbrial biogenesis protein FimT
MRRFCRGFTLVEILVTLSISAILLAVAVPALQRVTVSSKLTALSNLFLAHLTYARSEAIKRNGRTAVCKSSTGVACTASGDWAQGWIVFHDLDNDAMRDVGEALLLVESALPVGLALCGNSTVADYVSYAPTGAAVKTNGAFQAGSLYLYDTATQLTRRIAISISGRVRIEQVSSPVCS